MENDGKPTILGEFNWVYGCCQKGKKSDWLICDLLRFQEEVVVEGVESVIRNDLWS